MCKFCREVEVEVHRLLEGAMIDVTVGVDEYGEVKEGDRLCTFDDVPLQNSEWKVLLEVIPGGRVVVVGHPNAEDVINKPCVQREAALVLHEERASLMVGVVERCIYAYDGRTHRATADLLEKIISKLKYVVLHHKP